MNEKHRKKLKKGWLELVFSSVVCLAAMAIIWDLEKAALAAGINGARMSLATGAILGIALAITGVKLKDVLR